MSDIETTPAEPAAPDHGEAVADCLHTEEIFARVMATADVIVLVTRRD